jgi:choline dehydrogenase-like flavoprotein
MKALGGTTRLWGGQLTAFSPADFAREIEGSSGWPVSFDEMSPYVARAIAFLGVGTENQGVDDRALAAETAALDLGPDLEVSRHLWLPVADFVSLFGRDLMDQEGLTVVTDAEVQSLAFENGEVRTVHAHCADGSTQTFTPRHVVLANGTAELVRLLLRSAATDPSCPFRSNPHIGRGFIDHLHGVAGRLLEVDRPRLRRLFETRFLGGVKISSKIRASDSFILRGGHANCAAMVIADASISQYVRESADLLKRIVRNPLGGGLLEVIRRSAAMSRIIVPMAWSYLVEKRGYNLFGDAILVGLEVEQLPTAESRLFLDPSEPPEHAPIGVEWRVEGREMRTVQIFCNEFKDFMRRSGLGRVELDPRVLNGDPSFLDDCHDAYHQMGGARMASRASDGVVDRDLRVFGVNNLWALGAAVFPSGSFANPTLLAMAFAHRLADRLARIAVESAEGMPAPRSFGQA